MKFTFILVLFLVAVVLAGIVYIFRPGMDIDLSAVRPTPEITPVDTTEQWPPEPSAQPGSDVQPIAQPVRITLKTSMGDINIILDGPRAPITVGNFVSLSAKNFYDGTTFHRVIPDFMIQGGDPISKDPSLKNQHGTGGPGYQFQDEFNERPITRGVMAMANSGPNTNGSQFFIVTAAAVPHLDGKHTSFGIVEDEASMAVVDAISKVEKDARDNPVESVVIQDVIVHGLQQAPETASGLETIE